MKIAINNACNSNCSYCFAKKMGVEHKKEMSITDFRLILNWMISNDDNFLVILGGEPTIHSCFKDILLLANEYARKLEWDVLILTNGILLGDYIDLINNKTNLLININPEDVISKEGMEKLTKSLDKVKDKQMFEKAIVTYENNKAIPTYKATLGCNLCAEIGNYSFFWNLVDTYDVKEVRVSVASPQNNNYLYDRDAYFKKMKPLLMDFVKEAYKRNILVTFDCSQIPCCYFSGDEIMYLNKVAKKSINNYCKCGPTIQINPDMNIGCCFGDKRYNSSLQKFDFNKNKSYYTEKIKNQRKQDESSNFIEKCKDCLLRDSNMCYAGCFGFRDGIDLD